MTALNRDPSLDHSTDHTLLGCTHIRVYSYARISILASPGLSNTRATAACAPSIGDAFFTRPRAPRVYPRERLQQPWRSERYTRAMRHDMGSVGGAERARERERERERERKRERDNACYALCSGREPCVQQAAG